MPFDPSKKSALIIVDMIVDSVTGAWPIYNAESVTRNAVRVREACYRAGIPVIQLQHTYRRDGLDVCLNEARLADGVTPAGSVEGTAGASIVPELDPADRDIVVRKNRWHAFFGTPIESILHSVGATQLIWVGGFTDACLGLSVFEGYFRDYPCTLIADAASCTNEFTHRVAVLTMANWIYDLTIFTSQNFESALEGMPAPRWYAGRHNTVPFASGDDVNRFYELILSGDPPLSSSPGGLSLPRGTAR